MKKGNQKNNLKINLFSAMEQEVLNFWDRAKIFEKSVEKEAPKGGYVFYDGPPFATGMPHYGHIAASLMKDAVPRYWTMKGYRVERRWGWDCHGLPVENLAEEELKLKDKADIEKIGIEKFNKYCESIVLRYANEWKKIIRRIGRWVDMENDYKTMDSDYMESIWWVFKSLWGKGLIYQGYKAMHICPRCGTTLSNFEVTQNYKDIKDISCTVKLEIANPRQLDANLRQDDKVYILAWTTTPWTLIGNVALAVGEDIDYALAKIKTQNAKIKTTNQNAKFILAKEKLNEVLGEDDFEIIKEFKRKDLIDLRYKPLFDYYSSDPKKYGISPLQAQNGWKIYGADFVNTEEGTGVVHIAPAFGEDDMEMGKKYNLPFIQHVDGAGKFKEEVKNFTGMEVKPKDNHQATDIEIIRYLAHKKLLFAKEKYEHSYPHCWRCDTPLLNYATESWFMEVTKIKKDLIKNNKKIHWVPGYIKEGRFGKWLEQARDWAISRNRYWGAPLPVWQCQTDDRQQATDDSKDGCGNVKVIGSIKELEKLSGEKITDLHKQFVDKITWKCEKCGGKMRRIPEVLDCWFESGSMPYAQEHYPFENKKKLENNFPADFIAEGVDQTRGWFYTLHVLANALEIKGKASSAFKNVIVNGIVLAEDGQKMSKRLNNYPDPAELFEKYSADAMRYYLLSSPVLLAENLNFSEQGVLETLRKVEMLLWNVYKFYAMYVNEKFKIQNSKFKIDNILDKWIIARLNQLIQEVTENMDKYVIPKAVRPIEYFINDLSTWYLRRSRDRFKTGDKQDKQAALQTTGFVLLELSKVMAPFMPFIAEQIWQRVSGNNFKDEGKSVHLEGWPLAESKKQKIESRILEEMEVVRKIVELGLAKRDEAGIKVRQPLMKLEIITALARSRRGGRNLKLEIGEEYIKLIKDEVNVKIVETHCNASVSAQDIKVKLDTTLTVELKQEGIKRELVRFINNLRKQSEMTIQDRARIYWECENKEIKQVIKSYKQDILKDTLADDIIIGLKDDTDIKKEVKIDGRQIILGVKKLDLSRN
ncbi:MAG: isoleucine--tRNA ligase [Patescibacteria group bacterium]|nr:isoleucine--tRNA ligase [Patescibacteria group bacterium]